jgi:hypothetical protein
MMGSQERFAGGAEQRRMQGMPMYAQLAMLPRELQQQFLNAAYQEFQRTQPGEPTVQDILSFLNSQMMAMFQTTTPSPAMQDAIMGGY